MNPDYDSINKPKMTNDLNSSGSLDAFLKELEAREKDLDMSSEFVVEIEEYNIEEDDDEIAQLEKLLATIEPNKKLEEFTPQVKSNFAPGNPVIPDSRTFSDLEAEIKKLNSEVSKINAERQEMAETMRRRSTDFENFKNRTERERAEIFRSVLSNLAAKVFPVIDNLERALSSANNHTEEKSPDFQQFIDGVGLINHQLSVVLEEMGIQPITAVGKPFNPHFHEAVATVQTNQVPHNTVVAELLRGYKIDDKVIRPSMVKVSANSQPSTSSDVSLEIE
ncbi:MAG: nucleotide exchange factor GrpE [Pyrinomonadaceae bacterium]|nr:nucleotide exchange factor GrpE [Pyrinomonadaceae bacterium]